MTQTQQRYRSHLQKYAFLTHRQFYQLFGLPGERHNDRRDRNHPKKCATCMAQRNVRGRLLVGIRNRPKLWDRKKYDPDPEDTDDLLEHREFVYFLPPLQKRRSTLRHEVLLTDVQMALDGAFPGLPFTREHLRQKFEGLYVDFDAIAYVGSYYHAIELLLTDGHSHRRYPSASKHTSSEWKLKAFLNFVHTGSHRRFRLPDGWRPMVGVPAYDFIRESREERDNLARKLARLEKEIELRNRGLVRVAALPDVLADPKGKIWHALNGTAYSLA